jgi:hypothetical protein
MVQLESAAGGDRGDEFDGIVNVVELERCHESPQGRLLRPTTELALAEVRKEMPKTVDVKENRRRLVQIGAGVEPELAAALAVLSDQGDRSVSHEIRRALREHIARSDAPAGAASVPRAERDAPGDPAAGASAPAGPER